MTAQAVCYTEGMDAPLGPDIGFLNNTVAGLRAEAGRISPSKLGLVTFPNWQTPRHIRLFDKVFRDVVDGKSDRVIITIPPRHGKALALDTPIPTPSGWTTMGELVVGDMVFDDKGQPTTVIAKTPVWKERRVYRVIADDGGEVVADGEHEWSVSLCRKRRDVSTVRTTDYLVNRQQNMQAFRAPVIRTQGGRRYITIEPAGHADTVCIQVAAKSSMFLAGRGMLPTRNSTYWSRLVPPWYLGTYPNRRIILTGYGDTFATKWGRAARDILEEHGSSLFDVRISPGSSAANRWDIAGQEGGLIAAGVGGGIVGHGAHLALIDDPIRSAADAASPSVRERIWEWFSETLYHRLEPGGAIILIQTRWHLDDLAGRLLARSASGEGDYWREIRLPAIAEEDDLLNRKPGEALWPGRYDVDALERIRRQEGSRAWAALYQQRPIPAEGGLFQRTWFDTGAPPERFDAMLRYWDLAATAPTDGSDPDWSVGLLLARDRSKVYWVLDVVRFRESPAEAEARIRSTAERDGRQVPIVIEREPGSAGEYLVSHFARHVLHGFQVHPDRPTGAKSLRAQPAAAAAECGMFRLVQGRWNEPFLAELETFPYNVHDDQVDALSGAYSYLVGTEGRPRLEDAFAAGGDRATSRSF